MPSDEHIREAAHAIVGNRLVAADHVPADVLGMVFMPLVLGALTEYTEDQVAQLGVFGIIGKHCTSGWGVNGWPTFMEFQVWPREALIRAFDLARRMAELTP
jgi:hypothetical protein